MEAQAAGRIHPFKVCVTAEAVVNPGHASTDFNAEEAAGSRNEPICFSPYLYRARNLIERFFNKIKQCRRVAPRYDKLAANYLAFIHLASIRLWLRVNGTRP
jgi:transposase